MSPSMDRSPGFQAECLVTALRKLGVEWCTVVGFSYGGMLSFKMAEALSDSVITMTDSISVTALERIGVKSSAELLLLESVKGLNLPESIKGLNLP